MSYDLGSFVSAPVAATQYNRDKDRIDALTGGVFEEGVFVSVSNIGESVAAITFSSNFVEKPIFSSGWEIGPAQVVNQGQFPDVSVGVRSWQFAIRNSGSRVYTGASLLIKINGQSGQTFVVHATFRGQGLWSPV